MKPPFIHRLDASATGRSFFAKPNSRRHLNESCRRTPGAIRSCRRVCAVRPRTSTIIHARGYGSLPECAPLRPGYTLCLKCHLVPRMSEATSGVLFPHIAALMRATMSAARQPSLPTRQLLIHAAVGLARTSRALAQTRPSVVLSRWRTSCLMLAHILHIAF